MSFFIVWNFSGNKRAFEVMSEREIMKNESVELASGAFETKSEAQAALSADLERSTTDNLVVSFGSIAPDQQPKSASVTRQDGEKELALISDTLMLQLRQANSRLKRFVTPAQVLAGLKRCADTGETLLLQPRDPGVSWGFRTATLTLVLIHPWKNFIYVRIRRGHSQGGRPPTPAIWPELRGFPGGRLPEKFEKWCQAEDTVLIEMANTKKLPRLSLDCAFNSWVLAPA
jgi:hypothetical protein